MKCVIIGGGWLGVSLAQALETTENEAHVSRRSDTGEAGDGTFFIYPHPDAAAFLATAEVVVLAFPPNRKRTEQYAEDCLNVIHLCAENCRFILTSSTSVYPDEAQLMTEEMPLTILTTGNERIFLAETSLQERLGDRLTIVRLAGLIGPDRYPVTAMSSSGKTYEGNEPLNVIHRDDAVGIICHIIANDIQGTLNACAPEHPSKGAYYTWMAEKLGCHTPDFGGAKPGGKTISSERSLKAGYTYLRPDPYQFLQ